MPINTIQQNPPNEKSTFPPSLPCVYDFRCTLSKMFGLGTVKLYISFHAVFILLQMAKNLKKK